MNERLPSRDVLVALAGLALLLCWEAAGWDLAVSAWYGSREAGFLLRDEWWLSQGLYRGGRRLSIAVLVIYVFLTLRGTGSTLSRGKRLAWLGVVTLSLYLIPMLKRFSSTSCPWDIDVFGGVAPYVPHWMLLVPDGGPGHCFPSGHVMAALGFLPLYFQWRGERPAMARVILAVVLCAAVIYGWVQLARGAHFVSHVMWSAWLSWTVCVVAARLLEQEPLPIGPAHPLPARAA